MKKLVLIAALLIAWSAQPGWAARKSHRAHGACAASNAVEAEQAIRYLTRLMVASSACKNTTYAEFALRNRLTIIRYQKTMIRHLHSTRAFDKWNTSLANEAALRQATVPMAQFCQQAQPLMQQASAFGPKDFRAYAAAQAATATAGHATAGHASCGR